LGGGAFIGCTSLVTVTIPGSITHLGNNEFYGCTSLTGVFFKGNAPQTGTYVFQNAYQATVYYLPGTTGWGATFGDFFGYRPTALWNPQVQTGSPDFGVRTNRFGFRISGTTNIPIVVEACTDFTTLTWVPLHSGKLTNGSLYFSDPQWMNYANRLYRIRWP
jgi:hypothetical protein